MSIGDNIRSARIKKGINQKKLADMLKEKGIDVGNTTISNWEKGISKPDPDSIEELCKLLDVDGNYILGFNNEYNDFDNTDFMKQYKILFDKDDKLDDIQKKFLINFLEEQHKKIDEEVFHEKE